MKKIISVSGRIGSGKDTIADYLVANHGFKKMAFAQSLKDTVSVIFGWDREMLDGSTLESREWREKVDPWWSKKLDIPYLTPRWVLQYWGTEVCRLNFHDDIWVASMEKKLLDTPDKVVITDARFYNELDLVKRLHGYTIRVERGPVPSWYEEAATLNNSTAPLIQVTTAKIHPSEFRSVGYDYNKIIFNDSTLEDLYKEIDYIYS